VRDVIISGLGIMPVRDRFKVFIIDEVHQLSSSSFNALLKSIEEPPPHVVFMMATTELDKIPETVTSRSQVYEFRTISGKAISEQLRRIVDADKIEVGDDSLALIARDAEGSMRDAQSKLDQVIAFTGNAIAAADVAAVLGLVGRDLLLDAVEAVADENAPAAFELTGRAVEMGYDLRAVCRELSRTVRDLLVLSVDPSRIADAEIAGEGERDRLLALVKRFSREDLLRAFDLLARAEVDIRSAAQPRYHLEMALLRWIHLRKLLPIEELIAGALTVGAGASVAPPGPGRPSPALAARPAPVVKLAPVMKPAPAANASAPPDAAPRADSPFKDAFLAEIRKGKGVLYNMCVAQAQKIEVAGDRITFTFSATQRALRDQFEQNRAWLESLAQQVSGRKMTVAGVLVEAAAAAAAPAGPSANGAAPTDKQTALRQQALADAAVQAMLEVFPAEIRDVEEI
jgi:DNA polymerase-3 subunit gamma/tau